VPPESAPHALIVMGVSGSGKTTIGEQLAARIGWRYEDADAFHPASNVAKMSAGKPLTDEDRWPWLRAIADEIDRAVAAGERVVIGCSALRRVYRDVLVHGRSDTRIVYLEGTQALIADRLGERKGHFMPPGLLTSQFGTLEPPTPDEHAVTVSIEAAAETIVDDILRQLKLSKT
jgi:carbohydrate kinase (thermoresistant glucokinase family)